MWLRISFFPDKPSFLAVVASDGNIYFKAADLGKFLGYSNISSFAKRYANKNLKDVIPPEFMPCSSFRYPNSVFPVMDFNDMIRTIRKTFRNHSVPFGENRIEELQNLWKFGTVFRDMYPRVLPISPRVAFAIHVRLAGIENLTLQSWIRKYVDMTLRMFERNKKTNNESVVVDGIKIKKEEVLDVLRKKILNARGNDDDNEHRDHDPPPSVNSTMADEINPNNECYYWTPPPSVMNPYLNCIDDNDNTLPPMINSSPNRNDEENMANTVDRSCRTFQMTYDNFEEPDEIHVIVRGKNYVYVKKC